MLGRRSRLKGAFLAGGLRLGDIAVVPQLAMRHHPVETTRSENDKSCMSQMLSIAERPGTPP
jgi:hypothetical protein